MVGDGWWFAESIEKAVIYGGAATGWFWGLGMGWRLCWFFFLPIVAGRFLFARRESAADRISSVRLGHLATTRLKLNSLRVCWMEKSSGWKEWVVYAAVPDFVDSPLPGKDSIIYEVTVEVDYGVPVDMLTPDRIKREGGQLVVRVPPPRIIGLPKIVMEESGRRDQRTEGSRPVEYEKLDQQVRDAAIEARGGVGDEAGGERVLPGADADDVAVYFAAVD